MKQLSLRHAAVVMAFAVIPALAQADEEPYRDAAEVRAELASVLACEASRVQYMRLASALTPLYYDQPAQAALRGWRKAEDGNMFAATYELPEPVTVHGHTATQVMAAGEGMLAVLDGDLVEQLSAQLNVAPSGEPLASHIHVREVRTNEIGDGVTVTVTQTVSTITTHPGKTLLGCEYRMNW